VADIHEPRRDTGAWEKDMARGIFWRTGFLLTMGTALLLGAVQAEAAGKVRISGTIETIDGADLKVKAVDGKEIMVKMKPGMTVSGIRNAAVADIKRGDFVGIGSQPTASGINGAVQVVIFPASMKGAGERDRAWDARPNGQLTNATVTDAVDSPSGPILHLDSNGGQRKINIPAGTTIIEITSATKDDLKAGAGVSIQGMSSDDSPIVTADSVRVGLAGAIPPR